MSHNNPPDAQISNLETQLRIIEASGVTDPIAFSSVMLTQATFPHSARSGNEKVLHNGDVTVTMYSRKGLPYGHYPRLIMCWLTREALRRNAKMPVEEARRIPLGDSLNGFLLDVGIIRGIYNGKDTAKKPKKRASGSTYKALRGQLERLFSTTVSIDYTLTSKSGRKGSGWDNLQISDKGFLWWDDVETDEDPEEPYVLLTDTFFRKLVDGAVPLDPVHLAGISRSPMALDIYTWSTRKFATHKGFTRVTWQQLKGQLGTSYPDTAQGRRDFRKKARVALAEIKRVWPEANITDWGDGLEPRGNDPAIPKRDERDYLDRLHENDPAF